LHTYAISISGPPPRNGGPFFAAEWTVSRGRVDHFREIPTQLRDMAIFQGSKDETVINGDNFTYRLFLYGMKYEYIASVRESGDNVTLRIETELDNADGLTRQFELLEKFICQQDVNGG
jgi:hypothetical protein